MRTRTSKKTTSTTRPGMPPRHATGGNAKARKAAGWIICPQHPLRASLSAPNRPRPGGTFALRSREHFSCLPLSCTPGAGMLEWCFGYD